MAWTATEQSTDSRTVLLDAVPSISDAELRSKFQPLVAAWFTRPGAEQASNVRLAAIRVLPLLGAPGASANFATLAAFFPAGTERGAAARAMLQLPREGWVGDEIAPVPDSILGYAKDVPAAQRTSQEFVEFVEIVQLGNELSSRLPEADGTRLHRALRELGVSVFVVKSVREQMRFDTTELVVEAGKPFEIIFENVDVMPHNLVLVAPGSRQAIGAAAMTMPATPDKSGRLYVPDSKQILGATKMLEPGQKETLKLRAPREPGDYEFVCTFPGHWTIMWGKLIVTNDPEGAAANSKTATPAPSAPAHQHGAPVPPKENAANSCAPQPERRRWPRECAAARRVRRAH